MDGWFPEGVIGTVIGLGFASLIHWLAPRPEPLFVEAALVAFGFVGGLCTAHFGSRREP